MPRRERGRDLGDRADPAIGRDQQRRASLGQLRHGRLREPVAVLEPTRDQPVAVGAQLPQGADQDRGRADAVDVVVAVDRDPAPGGDRRSNPLADVGHCLEQERVVVVGGLEEVARLLDRAVAAANERHGDRLGERQLAHQPPGLGVVEGRERECCGGGFRHAARLGSAWDGTAPGADAPQTSASRLAGPAPLLAGAERVDDGEPEQSARNGEENGLDPGVADPAPGRELTEGAGDHRAHGGAEQGADDPAPEAIRDEHREVPDRDPGGEPDERRHSSPPAVLAPAARLLLSRRRLLGALGLRPRSPGGCRRPLPPPSARPRPHARPAGPRPRPEPRPARAGLRARGLGDAVAGRRARDVALGLVDAGDDVLLGEGRHVAHRLLDPGAPRAIGRLALLPRGEHRRGDEDRRVGSREDPDHHREGEVAQRLTAEDEQHADQEDGREAGDQRSGQDLGHRAVDDLREGGARHPRHVLADSVEDDDRVVHRVAEDGQEGGDGRARAPRAPSSA